jgi:hypothetical protein
MEKTQKSLKGVIYGNPALQSGGGMLDQAVWRTELS